MTRPFSKNRSRRQRHAKKLLFVWGMLLIPLLQFAVFFLYVNLDSVLLSFQVVDYDNGTVGWGLDNYRRFFMEMVQLDQIRNAVEFSAMLGLNDALLVLISTILAFFLFKKIAGSKFFRVVFFLPSIISMVVYVMAFKYMFSDDYGIVNHILFDLHINPPMWFSDPIASRVLILMYCLWVGTGYNVLVIGGAMSNVSKEVLECSKLEGVSWWRELFQIIIPMIWPTLSVAFLGSVMVIFTLFLQVQLITGGGPNGATDTIAFMINNLATDESKKYWASTLGVCFSIAATPIILVIRKLFDHISHKWGYE